MVASKYRNNKLIRQNPIDIWLQTDASLKGWGAECNQISIGCRWTVEESKNYVNYLELLAIFLGLKAFFQREKDKHICIKSANSTTVAYINNMRGMTSELLNELGKGIWLWCRKQNIFSLDNMHLGLEMSLQIINLGFLMIQMNGC